MISKLSGKDESEDFVKPPSTNRGVTYPKNSNTHVTTIEPFFDWFQGLIVGQYEEVEKRLLTALHGRFDEIRYSKHGGKNVFIQRGWQRGMDLRKDNVLIFSISYGGQNGKHGNWFKTTGSNAKEIGVILQGEFGCEANCEEPELLVSRIDVAIDVRADFMEIVNSARTQVEKFGLRINTMGDWLSDENVDGRTLYLIWTANTKMRIYEKGKQMRGSGEDENAPLDWIRLEIEIHAPDGTQSKLFKQIMAGQTPQAVWQSYLAYLEVLNATGIAEMDYIPIKRNIKLVASDFDRKQANMVNQYGNQLRDGFNSPEYLSRLIVDLYPMEEDIPDHLKLFLFEHLEQQQFLKHGEY
jgi:hypothetical protein